MSETSDSDKIRAAIGEIEELARRALNGPFEGMRAGAFTDGHEVMPNPSRVVKVSILPMGWDEGPWAPIYVAFDPEVVLRRCAADRKLLDWLDECEGKALDNNWWSLDTSDAVEALGAGYGLEL